MNSAGSQVDGCPGRRHHHRTSRQTAHHRQHPVGGRVGASVLWMITWFSATAMAHDEPQGNRPPTRQIKRGKGNMVATIRREPRCHTPWPAHTQAKPVLSPTLTLEKYITWSLHSSQVLLHTLMSQQTDDVMGFNYFLRLTEACEVVESLG